MFRADGVPARADRIEDDQLVEVQRRHLQQRKLCVREGRVGVVEKVVLGYYPYPLLFNDDGCRVTIWVSATHERAK